MGIFDLFYNPTAKSLADYPCGTPENIEYQAWQLSEELGRLATPFERELRRKLKEAVAQRNTLAPSQVLLNEVRAQIEELKHGPSS